MVFSAVALAQRSLKVVIQMLYIIAIIVVSAILIPDVVRYYQEYYR